MHTASIRATSLLLASTLCAISLGAGAAAAQDVGSGVRRLDAINDHVFLGVDGEQASLIVVTTEGIVIVDPLNRRFAKWLGEQLQERFPGKPVRYLTYTTIGPGRSGGGRLLHPTEVVAQDGFGNALSAAGADLPRPLKALDANGNHSLEAAELKTDRDREWLDYDANGDGHVTPGELVADIAVPTVHFDASTTLTVGDRRISLIHTAVTYVPDQAVVYLPDDRLVFCGDDDPDFSAVPVLFERYSPNDLLAYVRTLRALDFDSLITGRGEHLTRQQFDAASSYLEDLIVSVKEGYQKGRTLVQMSGADLLAGRQPDPQQFDLARQVPQVYSRLHHIDAQLGTIALVQIHSGNPAYCAGYTSCSMPWRTSGLALSGGVEADRFAFSFELGLNTQMVASRQNPPYDEAFAYQETRTAGLVKFRIHENDGLAVWAVGGVMQIDATIDGYTRRQQTFLPQGGLHPFSDDQRASGFIVGADVAIPWRNRVRLTMPLRLTHGAIAAGDRHPRAFGAEFGFGLTVRLARFAYY